MKCENCGSEFDFPLYTTPNRVDFGNEDIGESSSSEYTTTMVPVCPYCLRFTGYKIKKKKVRK